MHEPRPGPQSACPPSEGVTATLVFSSDKALIPGICQACNSFAHGHGGAESPELTLVLRELLANAVEHGNGNDPAREVTCQIALLAPCCVEVTIGDQGAGFEPGALDLGWPDQPLGAGAGGLRIVSALSDSLHFEDGGRRVVCRLGWNGQGGPGHRGSSREACPGHEEDGA